MELIVRLPTCAFSHFWFAQPTIRQTIQPKLRYPNTRPFQLSVVELPQMVGHKLTAVPRILTPLDSLGRKRSTPMTTDWSSSTPECLCGTKVTMVGWVCGIRRHPNITFVMLKGCEGEVQVVSPRNFFSVTRAFSGIRDGYCLRVCGLVQANASCFCGVEVLCYEVRRLGDSEVLPFSHSNTPEDTRLKYRFLDIRLNRLNDILMLRHRTQMLVHRFLCSRKFVNVETPLLSKGTFEGAKEYLVPSRAHPSKSYTLPQSPQLLKQLLMVGGLKRYYQIVKCFRDEDLRADRQPEFTQIDCEMSTASQGSVVPTFSSLVNNLVSEANNASQCLSFSTSEYASTIRLLGSDKPDLRIRLRTTKLVITLSLVEVLFVSCCCHLPVLLVVGPSKAVRSNKLSWVCWTKVYDTPTNLRCPKDLRNSSPLELHKLLQQGIAEDDNVLFFVLAVNPRKDLIRGRLLTDASRSPVGRSRGHVKPGWIVAWLLKFPLFKYAHLEQKLVSFHHPFTKPSCLTQFCRSPYQTKSKAYDITLNGHEIGGGSIRIRNSNTQASVFGLLGVCPATRLKVVFFLNALKFGAPPHGGIALGLDRLLMLVSHSDSVREVIVFPKTQKASCALMGAPD